jgi:predicted nucleic acid-binding protein
MNGIELLADTNFIIHLNQGALQTKSFLDYKISACFITEIELLGAYNISNHQKEIYKQILDACVIYEMNIEIKKKCIALRNNYKIKTPDAIIAATAIVHDLPLLTLDYGLKTLKN